MARSRTPTSRGVRSRVNPRSNGGGRRLRAARPPCAGVRAMPRSFGCSASPGMSGPKSSTSIPPDGRPLDDVTRTDMGAGSVRTSSIRASTKTADSGQRGESVVGRGRVRSLAEDIGHFGARASEGGSPRCGTRKRYWGSTRLQLKPPEVVSVTRAGGACPERGSSHRSHGPAQTLFRYAGMR